jgi:hypothetical protein
MYLREIGVGVVDWIRLAQDRDRRRAFVNAVMNLRVLAPRSEIFVVRIVTPCRELSTFRSKVLPPFSGLNAYTV